MAKFDTINEYDMENAPIREQQATWQTKGLIETRVIRKWLSDSIDVCKDRMMQVKFASLKRKSELGEIEDLLNLDKLVNFGNEVDINCQWTTESTTRWNDYATNVDGFTSLNIPSVSQQHGKTNLEIERTAVWSGAPTTKNLVEMASEWWRDRSYVHKIWPMKAKNESQSNFHHTLLLIFTLLATITFHMALKFYLPRCILQEGYETNSSLDPNFQIENQSSYSTRILFRLNSVAFFLSAGMMMVLVNELPYRPWLLALVFSMIGSYICILMNPMNPSLCSS